MMGWVMLLGGLALGAVGITAVVASSAANQVELYRWITGRESGAAAARALLSAQSRMEGAALGIASTGTLMAGIGLPSILSGLTPLALVISVVFLVVPVAAAALHALPNAIGRRWPETTVALTVPFVRRLAAVLAPVAPRGSSVRPRVDLVRLQAQRSVGETIGADDLSLVSGVLEFTERQVREVMTPRTDVVAVAENSPHSEICSSFVESGFSRLPAYSESLDNIVGMYYAFDLLKLQPGGQLPLRPVTLVPMTRPCADLLFEMQHERRHVAVVLDEFGGTAGMVTLNDLLAELVDETFEAAQTSATDTSNQPAVLELAGSAPVADVAQLFEIVIPGGAETVGGFLSGAVGRIPMSGERFELAGLEFDVVEATATRVERVLVRRAVFATVRLERESAP